MMSIKETILNKIKILTSHSFNSFVEVFLISDPKMDANQLKREIADLLKKIEMSRLIGGDPYSDGVGIGQDLNGPFLKLKNKH